MLLGCPALGTSARKLMYLMSEVTSNVYPMASLYDGRWYVSGTSRMARAMCCYGCHCYRVVMRLPLGRGRVKLAAGGPSSLETNLPGQWGALQHGQIASGCLSSRFSLHFRAGTREAGGGRARHFGD